MSPWRLGPLKQVLLATLLLGVAPTLLRGQDAPPAEPAAAPATSLYSDTVGLDTLWVLVSACLVFWMNAGFGCVEAGFCRAKNAVNILGKNFVVFGLASVAFWVIGWSLMFGDGATQFAGWQGLFLNGADNSPATGDAYKGVYSAIKWSGVPLLAKFFFQLVFAGTAATIVSGCVAERIHYKSFVIFAALLVAISYPITGHWVWGGGWLSTMKTPFWDFAGSTVVHTVGGVAGLIGIIMLGPRMGKYRKDGKVHAIPGHSMGLAFIGGLILWLGWFGFNPGSVMGISGSMSKDVAHIFVATNMGGVGGMLAATIVAWMILGKPDFGMTVNGLLAGLVAITAPCAWVTPAAAFLIGIVAGLIVVGAVLFFDRIRIDDPVGALAVHLANGVWGTLAIGLFANPEAVGYSTGPLTGLFVKGGGIAQLISQLTGSASVIGFTAAFSFVVWGAVKAVFGLRVSPTEEVEGLDRHEMGSEAYPHEPAIDVSGLLMASHLGRHEQAVLASHPMPQVRSAKIPPPAERYAVRLDGVNGEEFKRRWSDWCGLDKNPPPPPFKEVYPHVTTISNGTFSFRGGDRQKVTASLEALARSIEPSAKATLQTVA